MAQLTASQAAPPAEPFPGKIRNFKAAGGLEAFKEIEAFKADCQNRQKRLK